MESVPHPSETENQPENKSQQSESQPPLPEPHIYPRKYDEQKLKNGEGKKFFREKFLHKEEQHKEHKRRYTRRLKQDLLQQHFMNLSESDTASLSNSEIEKRGSIRTEPIHKKNNISVSEVSSSINSQIPGPLHSETQNTEGDKDIRRSKELFLKKVEKSIFSFNLKKYEDSYNVLLLNEIVSSVYEYGEFLLVISGFDKYILGEFLAKKKRPNEDGLVLDSFINCCEFKNKTFLESFRFLLSKINLPKDANMILTIIDKFSSVFFHANEDSRLYKSVDAVYLLASSVLALNTMFTRTDIKNLIVLGKEEFVTMNVNVSPIVVESIYEELKQKKIDMKHDYNEIIYQRLSQIISEKSGYENTTYDQSFSTSRKEAMSFTTTLTKYKKEDEEMLKKGDVFLKYTDVGRPQPKFVMLNQTKTELIWMKPGSSKTFASPHCVNINDIKDITIGIGGSPVFKKHKIDFEFENNCLTIHMSDQRTIDLRKDNKEVVLKWYKALRSLTQKIRAEREKKNEKIARDTSKAKEENIFRIWKEEIIIKWKDYREYTRRDFVNSNFSSALWREEQLNLTNIISKLKEKKTEGMNLTQKEFFFIYSQGIPKKIRKELWNIMIGNYCGIRENLLNSLMVPETIEFEAIEKSFYEKGEKDTEIDADPKYHQIIIDILKIKEYFLTTIVNSELDCYVIMSDLFKVITAFLKYRPDIIYNKHILAISILFLINGNDYFNTFIGVANIICQSHLLNFLLQDEDQIQSSLNFFDQILKRVLPKVYSYLEKFEITSSLYLIKWIETLFAKMFTPKILVKIWDLFILKGDCVLYQTALAIFKLQQDDLVFLPICDIFQRLKKLPDKYKEEEVLEAMRDCDITKSYINWKNENELAKEKCSLFSLYMNDTE